MDRSTIEEIKKRVLVFGWYDKNNIGDEAFKKCFTLLCPNTDFVFCDKIPENVNSYHCVFFGGGDLFDQVIPGLEKINVPIGLIGVGYGNVHESNKWLFERADLVITRNPSPYLHCGDLCFSLPPITRNVVKQNHITVLMNDFLTPRKNSPDWIRESHNWFISEFSDALDGLVVNGNIVEFVPFCVNRGIDDRRAASYVISKMSKRDKVKWNVSEDIDFDKMTKIISQSSLVITQRLHGSIFSYMCNTPQVSINHHDKMHKFCEDRKIGSCLNYYGFNKELFLRQLNQSYFNDDRETYLSNMRITWHDLSLTIIQKFNL